MIMRLTTACFMVATALLAASLILGAPIIFIERVSFALPQLSSRWNVFAKHAKISRITSIRHGKELTSVRKDAATITAKQGVENVRIEVLEARGGIDSAAKAVERMAEAAEASRASTSQAVEDSGRTATSWRDFLDPNFKLDFAPGPKFDDAVRVVRLRRQSLDAGGKTNLKGVTDAERKEYRKARRLLDWYARTAPPNSRFRFMSKVSPAPQSPSDVPRISLPPWVLGLDDDIQKKLRMRPDGKVHLQGLSEDERRTYDSAYDKHKRAKKKARNEADQVAASMLSESSLLREQLSTQPALRAENTAMPSLQPSLIPQAASSPGTPSGSPALTRSESAANSRTLKRPHPFDLNEPWVERR